MSDSCVLPGFDATEAAAIAKRLFALEGPLQQLDGERDLNFLIGDKGSRYVFKIANVDESPALLECQHQVFERLAEARVFPEVATARASVNGQLIETVYSKAGHEHVCRLMPYIEGRILAQVDNPSPALLEDLGGRLARLDQALESFAHPALERPLLWKMDNALDVLEAFKPLLTPQPRRDLVEFFEAGYRERVLPRLGYLRRAVIHNDANRANVLVDDAGARVVSIIDFGDMVESWLVVEPAVAATYAMLDRDEPVRVAAQVLRGYHAELPLGSVEIDLALDFICMRLCMSVCINTHQSALEPDNRYLLTDVESIWQLLGILRETDAAEARAILAPE
ncbi:MAG: phosphotransferase [Gammaproteobacteria bacterium]|nr:phosphotransferase [Gammaproteobacteria bacterium]MDH3447605.1 phosphotransferase [Gammaproteobacteria bacterium]